MRLDQTLGRGYGRCIAGLVVLAAGWLVSGCQTASYYQQAIRGQCQIVLHQERIETLLTATTTHQSLKEKFRVILQARAFAEEELKLPAGRHYLNYVDVRRRFVVWNLHAAPEFTLEPMSWCYPFIGSAKYRGFFSEQDAARYAETLRQNGYDVYVEGVEAYSTLGWFADPVLNTFVHHDPPELAEIIFHELTHQRLFIGGDTDFNEALATTVAEEGLRRWLQARQDEAAYAQYQAQQARQQQFVKLVMGTRHQLEAVYGDDPAHPGKRRALDISEAAPRRQAKEQLMAQLRRDYEVLKAEWGGYSGYDEWFRQPLNNAQLNTVDTYYTLVPAFRRILQAHDGNLEQFFKEVRRLSKLPKEERQRQLQALL